MSSSNQTNSTVAAALEGELLPKTIVFVMFLNSVHEHIGHYWMDYNREDERECLTLRMHDAFRAGQAVLLLRVKGYNRYPSDFPREYRRDRRIRRNHIRGTVATGNKAPHPHFSSSARQTPMG